MALFSQEKRFFDLGFSTQQTTKSGRMIAKTGNTTVRKQGRNFLQKIQLYHFLTSVSWLHFFLILLAFYFCINLTFASIYFTLGPEQLSIGSGDPSVPFFLHCLFFSAQTITTVGYGNISPISIGAMTVSAIESFLGLLAFALATGLLYARFSKPEAKVAFSHNAVIAPYQDGTAFMLRLANFANSQLFDVEATLVFSLLNSEKSKRDFYPMALERDKITNLPSSWTLVHPLNSDSPFSGLTQADLQARKLEVLVILKAHENQYSATVYSRTSYIYDEIMWDSKFTSMLEESSFGTVMRVDKLNAFEKLR